MKEVEKSDDYLKRLVGFIKMLSEFDKMWDGHLQPSKVVPYSIKLSLEDALIIYSAPYWAGLKPSQIEKNEVANRFKLGVIGLAHTEWA